MAAAHQLGIKNSRVTRTLKDWASGAAAFCAVITGDRQDRPPRDVADLMAPSTSHKELHSLLRLKAARDAVIITHKQVFEDEANARPHLEGNILVIGSHRTNSVSRSINKNCCHRAVIPDDAQAFYAELESLVKPLRRRSAAGMEERLRAASERVQGRHDAIRGTALVNGKRYEDPMSGEPLQGDGLITIAPNPWSEEHIAVVVAGETRHYTRVAVQMLGQPDLFAERPFGGVFHAEYLVLGQKGTVDFGQLDLNADMWQTDPYEAQAYLKKVQSRQGWSETAQFVSRFLAPSAKPDPLPGPGSSSTIKTA